MSARHLAEAVRSGARSARSVLDEHMDAIAAREPEIHAFNVVLADEARAAADEVDRRVAAGEDPGPLAGVPVAVKDNMCTRGIPTTCSSRILEGWIPPYDATVVERLAAAGAVMVGKTNLDEFAMGSSTENSAFGATHNPLDTTKVPGGSSGGSAAAVAAGFVPLSLGSDTGGSIRQPAAFCGVVGMKPTYGRCSRWGIVAFASSLDQAGPVTRTVRDAAIMLGAMAGFDPRDSTSADLPVPDFEAAVGGDVRGLRIGIPAEYRVEGMDAEIDKTWRQGIAWLKSAGAEIVDISLPRTQSALPAYHLIAPAEASSNLARYDGMRYGLRVAGATPDEMYRNTRGEGFGTEVRRRILVGTYALSAGYYDAFYLKAQKVRMLVAQDFAAAFETVDAILTPTAPSAAFAIGDKVDDPIAMYLNDVFTVPGSLAGLPVISVPVGLTDGGLPLGLQLAGRAFDEETVFRVAGVLEAAAGFTARPDAAG